MTVLAMVHPTGLLAVEVREALDRRQELWRELTLWSDQEEEVGALTEVRGGAAMVGALDETSFEKAELVFFFGSELDHGDTLEMLPPTATAILVATDGNPHRGMPVLDGINLEAAERGKYLVSPNPAVTAMAHILAPLRAFGLRSTVATVLRPASTFDKAGLDEMLEQTQQVLNFQSDVTRNVLPGRLTFNVLDPLAPNSQTMDDLCSVLSLDELSVSVHELQVGVFHGYGISLYFELANDPGVMEVAEALADHPHNQQVEEPSHLGVIDVTGSDKIMLGDIQTLGDGRYQLWAVMDNLVRAGSVNVVSILEGLTSISH